MGRYLVIRNHVVENVVLWDGKTPWNPPEGCIVIDAPRGVGPKFTRQADGSFVAPPEPEPAPAKPTAEEQIAALSAKVDEIAAKLQEKEPK